MYLEKLEINGFKSFAKKTELDFKPGITAIVGPNGSGKSNVADAVRWVLGEQSLKMLRGKKSADVIFSGSDKKARLGMAEVSLYFNNEKDENNVGMSEICITRKLYRSGESEYLVNKQKSRLADIQMLLAKVGMAQSSYSIIGQGMIDAFLLASPQERKEFFEEASGVKPLQIKRTQALNKLENTEENLETAEIQLREITPRLNSLTRQVKKLERRAEIEIKLRSLQHNYYACLWHEINNNWQLKHEEMKIKSREQEKLKIEVDGLQEQMSRLTKESENKDFEILQQDYQKSMQHKMDLAQKISEIKIAQAEELARAKHIKGKDMPHEQLKEINEMIAILNELHVKISDFIKKQDINSLEKCFIDQQKVTARINDFIKPYFEDEQQDKKSKLENLKQELNSLEDKLKLTDEKIVQLQEKINKESEKEKQERSQIWEIQEKSRIEQDKLNQLANEVNSYRVELARLETKKDDLSQEIIQEVFEEGLNKIKKDKKGKLSEDEKRQQLTDIAKLKKQLDFIGGIDPEVQTEYEEISSRHKFLSGQTEDLKKSIKQLEELILELDENIKKQFESSFKIINEHFQKYFKTLFSGGRSKLVLIKEEEIEKQRNKEIKGKTDEIEQQVDEQLEMEEETELKKIKDRLKSTAYAGVEIEATPPGKKLKSINMLSGGERALTSIALLCAIISANPSPFIILDEVDAALDEANSIRFAEILDDLAHRSQFILITHNRATMEKSDILYGVTMGDDGVSTLLSLKLESAEKYTNR